MAANPDNERLWCEAVLVFNRALRSVATAVSLQGTSGCETNLTYKPRLEVFLEYIQKSGDDFGR
jgi:hypothetical protein